MRKALDEDNRRALNETKRAYNSHKHDQAAFLCAGDSTLFPAMKTIHSEQAS